MDGNLIANEYWSQESHPICRNSRDPTCGVPRGDVTRSKVHLHHKPPTKDVTVGIGVRWHGYDAHHWRI
jgi:hypothetical protein